MGGRAVEGCTAGALLKVAISEQVEHFGPGIHFSLRHALVNYVQADLGQAINLASRDRKSPPLMVS
jgi:hypothetical protein